MTLNSSDVAPGVVIANNVIENNRQGGIRINGAPGAVSTALVEGPIGVARVLNNTIVGGGSTTGSVGIEVTERASPTIINNILAGHSIGISASGIGAPTIVLGGNLYKQNVTPPNSGSTYGFVRNFLAAFRSSVHRSGSAALLSRTFVSSDRFQHCIARKSIESGTSEGRCRTAC